MQFESLDKLSSIQLSAVKEISNIGLGHAATALANLTGQSFEISVPNVDSMPVDRAVEILGDPESVVLGVYMPFEGDVSGHLACLFPWESAQSLIRMLIGSAPENPAEIGELEVSVVLEIGNILNGNFLNAISDMSDLRMLATPPLVGIEMMIAVVESIVSEAEYQDAIALSVETTIFDATHNISGFFLFIPQRDGLATLLERLGVAEAA